MREIVVTLLSLLVLVYGKPQHQQQKEECALKGPEYWCKDHMTAQKCSAMIYCNNFVWKKASSGIDLFWLQKNFSCLGLSPSLNYPPSFLFRYLERLVRSLFYLPIFFIQVRTCLSLHDIF